MVVMDEDTCMVDMARRIMHFYAHESCGWCIPCREGTTWLRKMLERFHAGFGRPEDIDLVGDLAKNMLGRTFCPLGDAAALPTIKLVPSAMALTFCAMSVPSVTIVPPW